MSENGTSSSRNRRRGKIERLIDEYDLSEIGAELKRRRRGQDGDVSSLRQLTEFFNKRLLERRLSSTDASVLDGEVDNIYRLLTDDAVSSGDRTRARGRLKEAGIDIDQLEADFVSRESIRTYFKREGIERPTDDTDQVRKEADRIRQLRTQTATVTEDKLDHLRNTDRISLGEFRVLVDVQVFCEDCNTQYDIDELLEGRACNCQN